MDEKEAAADVSRLRSIGSMLGRSVPPLALGASIALVEIFTSGLPVFAGLSCLVIALVAVGCLHQAATFPKWAMIRTYELSYWNDGIGTRFPDAE
jgi:hypothetical protein